MGRNGEADLDRTLPRGELSIFAATRWDMRVLLSAVGHLTSTIIEARIGSRAGRECAGPCASANREGNPRTGRTSNSPFESLLQRVSRAAGRKALSIIRPAACVLLQQWY